MINLQNTSRFLSFLLLSSFFSLGCNPNKITLQKLQTEHLTNPIGIDASHPRFTWQLNANTNEIQQKEFHITVGTDSLKVAQGKGDFWNYESKSDSILTVYQGKTLQPFTKYYWGVSAKDNSGAKSNIEVASFETGMMNTKNWKGSWITDVDDDQIKPAPYFRKEISNTKKVTHASAYIVAAGYYELYLNGEKVGNHRLDPGYTRFDKRNLYVTYDVTKAFQQDNTAIGVLLGNGWYNHQSTAVWNFDKAGWRARPRFCLNIRVTYDDGTTETIVTDSSWKTHLSPVVFNSIYTGEHYDALKEIPGWNTSGFDASDWNKAITIAAPSQKITAQAMPPIRNIKEITPVSMKKLSNKHYIFDLGRNIAGVTKLKVKGEKGTKLWVTHAEQLDSIGHLDLSNIIVHYRPHDTLDPFQTDIYTLNGEEEVLMPKFNYKGFQYVDIKSSTPIDLDTTMVKGEFMHTDVKAVGKIHSSNELINKIWAATNASYLSNFFGYPTDCPQREKNGWTGDAHINIETGLYNFDGITVYEKWMADHRDEQQPNGVLPSIMPTWGWGYDWGNGPDWTSTVAIIPWELYLFYGDDKALHDMYEPIKKYVNHITSIAHEDGLTDWGLGDWVPVKSKTSVEFTSSIYYYVDATILAKAAQHFGNTEDYTTYSKLANRIKEAINKKYLNTTTGIYGSGFQTELSAPLYWGVVPEAYKEKVAANLAKAVHEANNHIDVGLLGTRTILGALSENGYADVAYTLAAQDTFPSWGWWIKNGATTLYENWNIDATSDISRNHIMFGTIGGWLYKGLGGIIPDEQQPGFKHIILKPHFVNGLNEFTASHNSVYGEIVSSWKREDGKVNYDVKIPANSTATIYINAESVQCNGKQIHTKEAHAFEVSLNSGEYKLIIVE
ncbi:glycoside hydrolase family 78 protein [Zhouia sp. PK063]|uniref:glycoside hydrolase family 78 protein n=1 Tax=Zhouia sp. PK063 TaxID=3373602 RepID=UPI0037B65062